MSKKQLFSFINFTFGCVFFPVFITLVFVSKLLRTKNDGLPRLVWGTTPIINFKYWSNALKEIDYPSITLMNTVYSINKKQDFDKYTSEIGVLKFGNIPIIGTIVGMLKPYIIFLHTIGKYDIVHTTMHGFCLTETPIWRWEARLFNWLGLKTVILPYGSDFYEYSKILDLSFRHTLLYNYPEAGRYEKKIAVRKQYWVENADIILAAYQTEGLSRWDALLYSFLSIDTEQWKMRKSYSHHNGKNGVVKISHSPNHRSIKASEFLIQAVDDLKADGYQVELVLIEKKPNDYVKQLLENEIDIHAEQFILAGYAMSGIEGMACGLPVMANLHSEELTRVFRRYSFLNECPILSTTPEQLKEHLRLLIENPALREELGKAGRGYVEKYHSYNSAQFLFSKIYDKIWYGKDVDLMGMYQPINPDSYNNMSPIIEHPLVENKLPISQ